MEYVPDQTNNEQNLHNQPGTPSIKYWTNETKERHWYIGLFLAIWTACFSFGGIFERHQLHTCYQWNNSCIVSSGWIHVQPVCRRYDIWKHCYFLMQKKISNKYIRMDALIVFGKLELNRHNWLLAQIFELKNISQNTHTNIVQMISDLSSDIL